MYISLAALVIILADVSAMTWFRKYADIRVPWYIITIMLLLGGPICWVAGCTVCIIYALLGIALLIVCCTDNIIEKIRRKYSGCKN